MKQPRASSPLAFVRKSEPGRPAPADPAAPPAPSWDGPEYAHVPNGIYSAVVTRHLGPQWVRRYQRWSIMLEFLLISDDVRVCAFYNMGNNPEKPHAGPQSRYFKAWVIANGGRPSAKQKLDATIFLHGQLFEIEVSDSVKDAEGSNKAEPLVYSRVERIITARVK
jgi:hypothetical protein